MTHDPSSVRPLTTAGHDPIFSPTNFMIECLICGRAGIGPAKQSEMLAWLDVEPCRPAPRCNEKGPGNTRCQLEPNHDGLCAIRWDSRLGPGR